MKAGIIGATVMFSVAEGVWSGSNDSTKAYNELKDLVVPQVSATVQKVIVQNHDLL